MFVPDDPLAPPKGAFAEPWQATVLAMATAMIREGHFTQDEWSTTLGATLEATADHGAPDTDDTYFRCALEALEHLTERAGITGHARARRKSEWEDAYRRTPHGKPVVL